MNAISISLTFNGVEIATITINPPPSVCEPTTTSVSTTTTTNTEPPEGNLVTIPLIDLTEEEDEVSPLSVPLRIPTPEFDIEPEANESDEERPYFDARKRKRMSDEEASAFLYHKIWYSEDSDSEDDDDFFIIKKIKNWIYIQMNFLVYSFPAVA